MQKQKLPRMMNKKTSEHTPNTIADQVSERVVKDEKGMFRWMHETNLYTNPMILFLVLKIIFFVWLLLALFMVGLEAYDHGIGKALENTGLLKTMLYVLAGLSFLTFLGYYLYALMMGGHYTVLFEMDQEGVKHTQLPSQFKRAKTTGTVAAIAGLAAGQPGLAGAGVLSASRQSMYTSFKKVQVIRPNPRRRVIKLRSNLMNNQVYTAADDFDFVLDYIREQVEKTSVKKN